MRIANAPCSWGITYPTGNAVGWRQYLDEVAAAGYGGTELGPFGYLPNDAALVRDELNARDLELVGATHVHTFGDASKHDELLSTVRDLGKLLNDLGARHLVIMDESSWYPAGREGVLDAAGWRGLVAAVKAAQEVIEGESGLKASFHPHIGTAVEREAQIDRLLDETDIDLCFDTGHHAFWDQDALAYLDRAYDRVAYMHLKNGAGVMCPLPDGVVDIPAVMRLLERRGFAGPIVVEQDLAANSPPAIELARRNLAYLGTLP
jgi:inosose dehydratase